jgi:hypothetical protein
MTFEEFTTSQTFQPFHDFDFMNLDWDASLARDPYFSFPRAFNEIPVVGRNQMVTSAWGGNYSMALNNIPWFWFQQMIQIPGWSFA